MADTTAGVRTGNAPGKAAVPARSEATASSGSVSRPRIGASTTRERIFIAGGMITGLIAISYLVGIPQWLKQHRENRQWVVVNNLTPDRLIKRCGKPLSDESKEIFPVIAREMTYRSAPSGTAVLKFSRTAEETSDWVFMSMEDQASGKTFETPIEKISALSCLDSSK